MFDQARWGQVDAITGDYLAGEGSLNVMAGE
jgi:hypothetical protein